MEIAHESACPVANRDEVADQNATARDELSPPEPERDGGAAPVDTAPTDADLEAAIVRAMLGGHGAVAEEIARQLRARREANAGNVLALPLTKRGR